MQGITRFLVLTVLAVGSLALALWLTLPRLRPMALDQNGEWAPTRLSWRFENLPEDRWLRVAFRLRGGMADTWRVVPDDCLVEMRANGQNVPLTSIPVESLSDWKTGFSIDLGPWLRQGENLLEFHVRNTSGSGGLQVRPVVHGVGMLLVAFSFVLFLVALNGVLPLAAGQRCILFLGLLVLLFYWRATSWETRTHDVWWPEGHFGYASWVADHLAVPKSSDGSLYYHPPLYYIVSAVILRGSDLLDVSRPESLQLFSLGLWLVFLVASSAALRSCLRGRKRWLLIATAALVLWPSGIIHSIRIGNDTPAYAACALASYCMIRWWKTRRRSSLFGMAAWCALALLCKTSSVAVVAAAGAMLGWQVLYPRRDGRWRAAGRTAFFGLMSMLGVFLNLSRNIYYNPHGGLSHWLVGNAGEMPDNQRVPADLKALVPLDIPTFLFSLWTDLNDDAHGRLNFWNYLLRSSLTGEFAFDGRLRKIIAFGWGICLLMLCGIILWRLGRTLPGKSGGAMYRLRPILLLVGFWLASLIALRIRFPYACSNDFRYIVPILLPAIVLAVSSGRLARVLLLFISLPSLYFFTSL